MISTHVDAHVSTHRIGYFSEQSRADLADVAVLVRECTPWVISLPDGRPCRPRGYQVAADQAVLRAVLELMRYQISLGFTAIDVQTGAIDAFAIVIAAPVAYRVLALGTRESARRCGLGTMLTRHVQGLACRCTNTRHRCVAHVPESQIDACRFLARKGFASRLIRDNTEEHTIEFTYSKDSSYGVGPAVVPGRRN